MKNYFNTLFVSHAKRKISSYILREKLIIEINNNNNCHKTQIEVGNWEIVSGRVQFLSPSYVDEQIEEAIKRIETYLLSDKLELEQFFLAIDERTNFILESKKFFQEEENNEFISILCKDLFSKSQEFFSSRGINLIKEKALYGKEKQIINKMIEKMDIVLEDYIKLKEKTNNKIKETEKNIKELRKTLNIEYVTQKFQELVEKKNE